MTGNTFLRTSVVFLTCGVILGLIMGGSQDFTQAPTHAHLNLIGGVWMFLAGLFYNAHPQISSKLRTAHYVLAVLGVLGFVIGLYGKLSGQHWGEPPLMIGSQITGISFLLFAVIVFMSTGKKSVLTGS